MRGGSGMEVSHNTRQLRAAARLLIDADVKTKVTNKVADLHIPATAWPLMAAFGTASTYGNLRETAEKAAGGLDTVVQALGRTVQGIASYYERMESQYGTDFDSADVGS